MWDHYNRDLRTPSTLIWELYIENPFVALSIYSKTNKEQPYDKIIFSMSVKNSFNLSIKVWDHYNRDLRTPSTFNVRVTHWKSLCCALHIHQNKQRGAIRQKIIFFLSGTLNFHSRRRFLIEVRHSFPFLGQRLLREVLVAFLSFHSELRHGQVIFHCVYKDYLLTIIHPLFMKISTIKISPQIASHAKKTQSKGSSRSLNLFG